MMILERPCTSSIPTYIIENNNKKMTKKLRKKHHMLNKGSLRPFLPVDTPTP